MLHNHRACRHQFQFPPHDLFAHDVQWTSANRAILPTFRQAVLHHLHRQIFRQPVGSLAALLPVVALHLAQLRFRGQRLGIGVDLCYVEKETGKVAYALDASIRHEPGKAKKIDAGKFIKRLAMKLKEREISGSELARRSGVSKQSISKYLLGERRPTWESSRALAKALEVRPEWLAGEE